MSRRTGPTSRSLPVLPGSSAFVESDKKRWTPRRASSARPCRSVTFPSIGVLSSLKSPEWRRTPAGRSIANAHPSGIECDTRWNRTVNGPVWISWPGATSSNRARSRTRCSSSLPSRRASVSFVPYRGSENSRSRYGSDPTWSSCPWVRTTASTRSWLSRRYWKSGRTRSIPGISTSGKDRPASITRMRPSSSSAAMLRPTSPTPPRKTSRGSRAGVGKPDIGLALVLDDPGVPHGLLYLRPLIRRRRDEREARRTHGPSRNLQGDLQGDGVRGDEQALEDRHEVVVDLARRRHIACLDQLDHLPDPGSHQVRR